RILHGPSATKPLAACGMGRLGWGRTGAPGEPPLRTCRGSLQATGLPQSPEHNSRLEVLVGVRRVVARGEQLVPRRALPVVVARPRMLPRRQLEQQICAQRAGVGLVEQPQLGEALLELTRVLGREYSGDRAQRLGGEALAGQGSVVAHEDLG